MVRVRGGLIRGSSSQRRSGQHNMTHGENTRIRASESHTQENDSFDENDEIMEEQPFSNMQERTRGPNQGIQPPRDATMRTLISIRVGSFDNASVSHSMGQIMRGHFNEAWPSWKKVPHNIKDLWWQQFKDIYRWNFISDKVVLSCWRKTCRNIFNGMLSDARRMALELSGKLSLLECLDYHPKWMTREIWIDLVKQNWSGSVWKGKSDRGRRNKLSSNNGVISKHTGGSASAGVHHKKMEEETGRPPSMISLYNRMHKKQNGKGPFIDEKSKCVYEKYDDGLKIKYGEDESLQPSWDPKIWADAIGGVRKGRVYGFGDRETALNLLGGEGASSWSGDKLQYEDDSYIQQKVQEMVAQQTQASAQILGEKIAQFEQRQSEQQTERERLLFLSWYNHYFPDAGKNGQMPPPPPCFM